MGRPLGHADARVAVTAGIAGTYGVVAVALISGTAGLSVKKPHPLGQTCQSAPALVRSFATAAFSWIVSFGCSCDGRDGIKLTRSVSGLIAMGLELMLTLGSAIEVAVSVTDVPTEVTGGAL